MKNIENIKQASCSFEFEKFQEITTTTVWRRNKSDIYSMQTWWVDILWHASFSIVTIWWLTTETKNKMFSTKNKPRISKKKTEEKKWRRIWRKTTNRSQNASRTTAWSFDMWIEFLWIVNIFLEWVQCSACFSTPQNHVLYITMYTIRYLRMCFVLPQLNA